MELTVSDLLCLHGLALTFYSCSLKLYTFRSHSKDKSKLCVNAKNLPSIYPPGTTTKAHAGVCEIAFEGLGNRQEGELPKQTVPFDPIENVNFTLDLGNTHVVEAIG
jgi:hypothetical protein